MTVGQWPNAGKFKLSARSRERLEGVHPDLVAVVHYAIRITAVDFGIPLDGGVRTQERQDQLVEVGASSTRTSRHLSGHAVDIYAYVDGKSSWKREHVLAVHSAFVKAAAELDVNLRWGGDWNGDGKIGPNDNDLVHHELPASIYGLTMHSASSRAAAFLSSLGY